MTTTLPMPSSPHLHLKLDYHKDMDTCHEYISTSDNPKKDSLPLSSPPSSPKKDSLPLSSPTTSTRLLHVTTSPSTTTRSLHVTTSPSTSTRSLHVTSPSTPSLNVTIPRMNSTPDCLVLTTHTPKRAYDECTIPSPSTPTSTRRASMPSTPSSRSRHFFPKDTSISTSTSLSNATITTPTFTISLTPFQPCAMSDAAQAACYRLPSLQEVISTTTRPNRNIHPSLLPNMYRSASVPVRLRSIPTHRTASSLPCFPTSCHTQDVSLPISPMWLQQHEDPHVHIHRVSQV